MKEVRYHEFEGQMYSTAELAAITGYTRRYINHMLERGDLIRRRASRIAMRFDVDGQLLTVKEIAAREGVSEVAVYERISANGNPLRDPACRAKYARKRELSESGVHEIGASNGENGLYWADDLEARVWHLHCGGDEFGECTLAEIAELWGLSRERVRQVENEAIRKIRRLARRGNKDALDALRWFEAMAEQRRAERPGHWEQAAMNAPGNFDLTEWRETVSYTDIARKFGDDRFEQRADVKAGRSAGAKQRKGCAA